MNSDQAKADQRNNPFIEEDKDCEIREDDDDSEIEEEIDPEERRIQNRFNHYGRFQKH